MVRARSRAPEHACWEEYRAEGARRQPRLFPLYYREAVYSRQVSLARLAPGFWHPDHALQEGLLRQAEARLASRIKVTMARKAALTKLKDESVAAVFPRVEEVYPTMFVRDLFLRLTEPLVAVSKEDVMVLTLEGGQEGRKGLMFTSWTHQTLEGAGVRAGAVITVQAFPKAVVEGGIKRRFGDMLERQVGEEAEEWGQQHREAAQDRDRLRGPGIGMENLYF